MNERLSPKKDLDQVLSSMRENDPSTYLKFQSIKKDAQDYARKSTSDLESQQKISNAIIEKLLSRYQETGKLPEKYISKDQGIDIDQ